MSWVKELVTYISDLFKWWIVILPWQEGIRVRLGKHELHLRKGIYLKLPVIDSVFVQNIRLKYAQIPIQTVTTKDGQTITIHGAIAYKITDIKKLYNSISNPDATITGIAMSKLSDYVANHVLADCTPSKLEKAVIIDGQQYGLDTEIKITGFASVKTFRLIQDHAWMPTNKDFEI